MDKYDLRVQKTFRQIDETLIQELENSTIGQLTVTALCQKAMINKSTFYRYYRSLEDCLDQFLDKLLDQFRSAVNASFMHASPGRIDDETYQEAFRGLMAVVRQNSRAFRAAWGAPMPRNFYGELVDTVYGALLQSALPDNKLSPLSYRQLYCRLFAEHTLTLLRWWQENEGLVTEADLMHVMTDNMKLGFFAAYRRMM